MTGIHKDRQVHLNARYKLPGPGYLSSVMFFN
jgi:hypothetical protein